MPIVLMHPVGRFSLCAHVLCTEAAGRERERGHGEAGGGEEDAALVQEKGRKKKERKTDIRFIIEEV